MKKRISAKEYVESGCYDPSAKWVRPFLIYSIEEKNDGDFVERIEVNKFYYALLFIPVHLIIAIQCMWDGGLKYFEFESRELNYAYVSQYSPYYKKTKEIYERA